MGILEMLNATAAMQNAYNAELASSLGISISTFTAILALIMIWNFIWKGFALWKAAMKKHILWFILILVVNSLGILEILYIFVFSKFVGKIEINKKPNKTKKKKF